MATKLEKKIVRETMIGNSKGEAQIIEITPDHCISFRSKGKRTRYTVHLGKIFQLALMQKLIDEYQHKMGKYNERKSLGLRAIKPKKPNLAIFKKEFQLVS